MEGHELFATMTKVEAPRDFEEKVLGRLPAAREQRARAARRATYRTAFAGSAAVVLVSFLLFYQAPAEKDAVLTYAEREALTASPDRGPAVRSAERNRFVPVYETMDYASEFRNAQSQPATVYILEQVSEIRPSEIIY